MYDPVTVFLIVLGLFSVGLFLLLCFLTREFPSAFVVKLVWWCWILLTFACLESSWFFYHIWRRILLGRVVVVGSFPSFPPLFKTYPAIASGLLRFCWETSWYPDGNSLACYLLFSLCRFLYFIFVFNFCQFDYYVSWCIPPWVYPSWDSVFPGLGWLFFSPMFGKFSAIISSNIFSGPYLFFCLSYPAVIPSSVLGISVCSLVLVGL